MTDLAQRSLRLGALTGLLAASVASASGPAPSAPAAIAPPPAAAPNGPFRPACDGEEFVFATVCTGRFDGVIGVALFDHRGDRWDPADDALLAPLGLRNVTDKRANYAPRADWPGLACEAVSGHLLELKGVLREFIYAVPLNKCRGFSASDGNFALSELELFVTPGGARIGSLEGLFRGHPDNTVYEGSFRDALVQRYGTKNCEPSASLTYCRQGARSRITVQQMQGEADGSRFWVRIQSPEHREQAIGWANQRIEDARRKAPVNDF